MGISSVEILGKYKNHDVLTCQCIMVLIFFEIFGTGRKSKGVRRNEAGMCLRATAGQLPAAGDNQESVYRKTNILHVFLAVHGFRPGSVSLSLEQSPWEGAGGRAKGAGVGMVP